MPTGKEIQYRYYETPPNSFILALLGENWVRPYGLDLPQGSMHFHNLLEIGVCNEGEGKLIFLDGSIGYSPGTITVIPENCPHHTLANEGTTSAWEYLFIAVEDFMAMEKRSNGVLMYKNLLINTTYHVTNKIENPILWKIITLMLDLYRLKPSLYLEMAKSFLTSLMISISNLNIGKEKPAEDVFEDNELIVKAIEYIHKNYMQQIKIKEVAAICHLSETHFRRIFESNMNISPLHYVNLVRIDRACRMLRNTRVPIQNIASECGFVTLSSFNRNFKMLMGTSPKVWRSAGIEDTVMIDSNTMLYNGWR